MAQIGIVDVDEWAHGTAILWHLRGHRHGIVLVVGSIMQGLKICCGKGVMAASGSALLASPLLAACQMGQLDALTRSRAGIRTLRRP